MAVISPQELLDNLGEVLRRAEAGEQFTVTISGHPVAELGPVHTRHWVDTAKLQDLWDVPPDRTLERDLESFD